MIRICIKHLCGLFFWVLVSAPRLIRENDNTPFAIMDDVARRHGVYSYRREFAPRGADFFPT